MPRYSLSLAWGCLFYLTFTEMTWRSAPLDISRWASSYVRRRYGAADPHALRARQVLLDTAYDIRVDDVVFNRVRWATYFRSLDDELRSGQPVKPIDWFAIGEAWNRGTQYYSDQPHGDAYRVAARIAAALGITR
jgi:Alpha-N-acetylglucosaminidase (NAGLU) C-terminal domain